MKINSNLTKAEVLAIKEASGLNRLFELCEIPSKAMNDFAEEWACYYEKKEINGTDRHPFFKIVNLLESSEFTLFMPTEKAIEWFNLALGKVRPSAALKARVVMVFCEYYKRINAEVPSIIMSCAQSEEIKEDICRRGGTRLISSLYNLHRLHFGISGTNILDHTGNLIFSEDQEEDVMDAAERLASSFAPLKGAQYEHYVLLEDKEVCDLLVQKIKQLQKTKP